MSNDFINIDETFDGVKFKFYLEYLLNSHIYAEGDTEYHKTLTTQMTQTYVDPLDLPKEAVILDLGCGPGYFLDEMKERGYTNLTGVTLSQGDIDICEAKGHTIKKYDLSFLPHQAGYHDESVDFIFLRHALEHSPFPIISLIEYNRVLKQGGKMYIEVPAPDTERKHEFNLNHYSVLGSTQLMALLQRTGFTIDCFNNFEFDVTAIGDEDATPIQEKFYCIIVTKSQCLDIK